MARFTKVFVAGMALWVIPAAAFCQDAQIQASVGALASEDFKERVEAQQRILDWANSNPLKAKDFLFEQYEAAKEPEVRMRLRESLMEVVIGGHENAHGQGYLGISMQDMAQGLPGVAGANTGVRVSLVRPDSPAGKAGLKVGDIILAMDKRRWSGEGASDAFVTEVKKIKPGTEVQLEVQRGGEILKIPVKLGARPLGMPERQPAMFLNGLAAVPDFELLEKMEKEARAAFFKDWLDQKRGLRKAP